MSVSQIKRNARRKGADLERTAVNMAKEKGFGAARIKGSGAQATGHKDITLSPPHHREMTVECKWRGDGFKEIYRWSEDVDVLLVKANRRPIMAVLIYETFLTLIGETEQ